MRKHAKRIAAGCFKGAVLNLSMGAIVVTSLPCGAMAQQVYAGRSKPERGAPYSYPKGPHAVKVERSRMIKMRDGVRLSSDIYRPVGLSGPLPVIYAATPYGKIYHKEEGEHFAAHGFVYVAQDVRGKFESEGDFQVEHGHGPDGFDTIAWLADQPWSNGRVGMIGCSYSGLTAKYTAKHNPPALKALVTGGAGSGGGSVRPDGNTGGRYGGVQGLMEGFNWMREEMSTVRVVPNRKLEGDALAKLSDAYNLFRQKPPAYDPNTLFRSLPVSTMMERSGSLPNDWIRYRGSPLTDPWFDTFDRPDEDDKISVPTIHMVSWLDYAPLTGNIYFWRLFQDRATSPDVAKHQHLWISTDDHCGWETPRDATKAVGDRPVGDARFDDQQMVLDWFNYWLKNDASAKSTVARLAPVQYYTTGLNTWQAAKSWPPAYVSPKTVYLSAQSSANSSHGDGRMSETPGSGRPAVSFVANPGDPVLTYAAGSSEAGNWGTVLTSRDQIARDARSDVLVFETEPLPQGWEVTGPIELNLWISADVPDTDIHAWLSDVESSGTAYPIQEGTIRVRYREGFTREVLMEPGKRYPVKVVIRDTSHFFKAGNRIRLSIAGSNFPRYIRNLNTGGDSFTETNWRKANVTVHLEEGSRSTMILPVKVR